MRLSTAETSAFRICLICLPSVSRSRLRVVGASIADGLARAWQEGWGGGAGRAKNASQDEAGHGTSASSIESVRACSSWVACRPGISRCFEVLQSIHLHVC